MSLDHRLIELLVCPICKGPLRMARGDINTPEERLKAGLGQPSPTGIEQSGKAPFAQELQCPADRLAFPIRDGIPIMLESEARSMGSPADDPA